MAHPNYGNVYDFPVEEILEVEDKSSASRTLEKPFAIYPNPSGGEVNLSLPASWDGNASISIRSLDGKLLKQIAVNNSHEEFVFMDVADWTSGVYLVEIISSRGAVYHEKLIVE